VSPAVALWSRVAAGTALSLALLVVLAPERPTVRLPWSTAALIGAAVGLVLFVAVGRCCPCAPARRPASLALAKLAFFALWATNEEVVWRRVALGELLGAGVVPAFAGSTLGFALMHRTRRGTHLFTGSAFGALYLATGVLAASVAAHWTYNLLVGALVDRERHRAHAPP
jgi:membrane protease YdiL (CAAX protease family)